MNNQKKHFFVAFLLPVAVISTQGGVSVQNNVTTAGNSDVYVESSVNQSSTQTSDVHVSNSTTTTSNNSNTKTHKKMQITINGKTKMLETDEPGTHTLEIKEGTGSAKADITIDNSANSNTNVRNISNNIPQFKGETISISQYIQETIQKFFTNFFSAFGKKL